jgi:hypothetical protein
MKKVELGTARTKLRAPIEMFVQGWLLHHVSGVCSGQQYGMVFSLPQLKKVTRAVSIHNERFMLPPGKSDLL